MSFLPTAQQNPIPGSRGLLRGGSLVAGIEVSVLISESHTMSAEVSKFALESGAQVSDHVIIEPHTVTISFEVTNTGLGPMVAKDVFETFQKMLEARERLELITEHHVYDNMVLTSFTPAHMAPYKGRLECTAVLQRINQVKLQTVGREEKKLAPGPTQKTASAEVDAGVQNAKSVNEGSLIHDWIFGKSVAAGGATPQP